MLGSEKLRVLLAAPKPPPVNGGIANWTRIVQNHLGDSPDLELQILDTKVRFRNVLSLNKVVRFFSGTLQSAIDSYRLVKAIRKTRPHIFHLCTSGSMGTLRDIYMLQIAWFFGVPSVIHYHMGQLPWVYKRQGLLWKLTHRAMSLADAVVTLDRHSECVIRPELPNTHVVTLPNCVEIDVLDAIRDSVQNDSPEPTVCRIVYVGMVLASKGVRELVQACAKLADRNIELVLVGAFKASFRKELIALACQCGSDEWLHFAGLVSHSQAMEHLAMADILVLPSHSEGAPNVILEAMSLERGIVATSVGAVPEMLDIGGDEECGICVPPGDVGRLTQAIVELLDNPKLTREMGINGRIRARRLYDAPVACHQLVDLWTEMATAKMSKVTAMKRRTKVMLVAPLPPPDHGGIANWSRILRTTLADSADWRLSFVDSTARYRKATNHAFLIRLIGGSLHAIKTLWLIDRSIRKHRPELIHICTSGGLASARNLITLKMAKHYGIPTVVHYRMGRIPNVFEEKGVEYRWTLRVMKRADAVITLDQRSEICVKEHLPSKRVIRLPNMVEVDVLDAICGEMGAAEENLEEFHVVFVGHILPTKGIAELVKAGVRLVSRGLHLHLVGPVMDQFHAELLQLAAVAGSTGWVHFHGPKEHDDAIQIMADADLVTLPSYTEGFPNVILEAMTLSKPILATNVGAIPEMLNTGGSQECGVVVPPRQVEPLAAALERLMSESELRSEIGKKARQRVEQLYAVSVACRQLTEFWESILHPEKPA